MAKPTLESDSNGTAATTTTTPYHTVFIDTSLETRLAMIVSAVDTVADFKKKLTFEHPKCFPKIGEIRIDSLKVKRRGYFYHLPDSMLVRSAFEGGKKNWSLSVDASSLKEHNENLNFCKPDAGNQLALFCSTNYPSGDRNDLLPDGPSKRLSIIHETSLLKPGSIQHANLRVLSADQSSPVYSCNEVSKDLEMEVKHITDDPCKNSSSATERRSDPDIQEKFDLYSEENQVPGTNAKHKDDNSRDEIGNAQCNNSLEGSLKPVPATKKKHKIKKNNGSKDRSHPEIVGPENYSGNAGREISNDMMVRSTDIGEEPCKTLSSDTSKRSDFGTRRKYDPRKGTEVLETHVECKNDKSMNRIGDVQCNNSLEEASQSGPTAKKKRKIGSKEGTGSLLKENKALVSNSGKETSKPETIIPENPIEEKQKSVNATSDGLFTELPEDVYLINCSTSEKSKRKRKKKKESSTPHDQIVSAVPSSLHEVGEESFKEDGEINPKDLGRVSDATFVPGESVQHATLSKHLGITRKEKHYEPVQEVAEGNKVPCSSIVAPAEVLVDEVNKAERSDRELKAKMETKKPIPSKGTSPDLQNPLKTCENLWSEKKSQGRNPGSIQLLDSLSKEKHNEVMLHSDKKSLKVSGNRVKAPCSQNIDQIKSIPQEARWPDVANGSRTNRITPAYLKENSKSLATSSSSSESCDRSVQYRRDNKYQSSFDRCCATVAKASSKNTGEGATTSQREKSLLATPGAIFRDGSSESSEDENRAVNSDASTRTPSDNSSSSGYSEGESKLSLDSPRNGSYGAKGKKYGGKNIIKSTPSGLKNISMDMILRGSSRFKEAKLTASQSQLKDTES